MAFSLRKDIFWSVVFLKLRKLSILKSTFNIYHIVLMQHIYLNCPVFTKGEAVK